MTSSRPIMWFVLSCHWHLFYVQAIDVNVVRERFNNIAGEMKIDLRSAGRPQLVGTAHMDEALMFDMQDTTSISVPLQPVVTRASDSSDDENSQSPLPRPKKRAHEKTPPSTEEKKPAAKKRRDD